MRKEDRIGQIICKKIEESELREVLFLNNAKKGENAFGSTSGTIVPDDYETKELLLELDKFLVEVSTARPSTQHRIEYISLEDTVKLLYLYGLTLLRIWLNS